MALGMTGAQMATVVSNAVSMDITNAAHSTEIYQWLNESQLDMYQKYDWPDLRVSDSSFTTDGSESYNITSMGRIIDRTVRIGNRAIYSMPKSYNDELDPARQTNGSPLYYQLVTRKDFRLYPYGSDGDIVYLDYIKYPTEITSSSGVTDISFGTELHEMIVDGAIWRGLKRQGITKEWMEMRSFWLKEMRDKFKSGRTSTIYPKKIIPCF